MNLSEANMLKEKFNSHKTEHAANTDAYNELRNENSSLSEQVKYSQTSNWRKQKREQQPTNC